MRRSERGWALPFRTFDRLLSCLLTELDGLYSNVRMGVFSDRAAKSADRVAVSSYVREDCCRNQGSDREGGVLVTEAWLRRGSLEAESD